MSAANKLSPQELNKVIAAAKDQYRHFIEQLSNLAQYAAVLNNFLPKIKAGDKYEHLNFIDSKRTWSWSSS